MEVKGEVCGCDLIALFAGTKTLSDFSDDERAIAMTLMAVQARPQMVSRWATTSRDVGAGENLVERGVDLVEVVHADETLDQRDVRVVRRVEDEAVGEELQQAIPDKTYR